MLPNEFAPPDRLGFATSSLVVYLLALILPSVLLALSANRALTLWKRARAARASMDRASGGTPLADGAAVVHGTVECDSADAPVEVRLFQPRGRRAPPREVTARPFRLVLASGEVVFVEPDARTKLVADFAPEDGTPSIRCAKLEPKARAFAMGNIRRERHALQSTGGYRDAGKSLVLRGTRREPLLLATKPLDAGLLRFARFHAVVALALLVVTSALQGLAFHPFHRLNVAGRVVRADSLFVTRFDPHGRRIRSVWGTIEGADGALHQVSDRTSASTIELVEAFGRTSLPFLVDPEHPKTAQIGTTPGVDLWLAILVVQLVVGGLVLYRFVRRRFTPWYVDLPRFG